jgi:hypothetical protein
MDSINFHFAFDLFSGVELLSGVLKLISKVMSWFSEHPQRHFLLFYHSFVIFSTEALLTLNFFHLFTACANISFGFDFHILHFRGDLLLYIGKKHATMLDSLQKVGAVFLTEFFKVGKSVHFFCEIWHSALLDIAFFGACNNVVIFF